MKKMALTRIPWFSERLATLRGEIESKLIPWYQKLPERERYLLLIAAVVLPVLLFVFGLWLPMKDNIQENREVIPGLEQQYLEVQVLANKLKRGGRRKNTQDLLTTIEQSAQTSHVRSFIVRLKPQPEQEGKKRLQIRLQAVPYQSLIYFLYKLAQAGVGLERAKMLATAKPGMIDVDLLATREK
jgi:type II secretory pathway component PulM